MIRPFCLGGGAHNSNKRGWPGPAQHTKSSVHGMVPSPPPSLVGAFEVMNVSGWTHLIQGGAKGTIGLGQGVTCLCLASWAIFLDFTQLPSGACFPLFFGKGSPLSSTSPKKMPIFSRGHWASEFVFVGSRFFFTGLQTNEPRISCKHCSE